ncbi:DUF1203 domain-containing protein [Pontibacter anaerobius]|uniref:DUF1203 domain-containing protein n=1 Tax=Pontibacter anaerobius TaxID=2993940 RepID=A0ABT3RAU0_9BACT|nr:DUF1203 domain-containing protein [Pontibacter anaerobius]MCX2738549.1 DUF1203 domain-containing protein [Pontibacter anaerobius]
MDVNFRISAIGNNFNHLFNWGKSDLSSIGAIKMIVDAKPGYPCRVSLEDAEIGEEVILLPFKHHDTDSPYQASGPIFVRKNAVHANLEINEIPKMLLHRLLSLRVYDSNGMMIDARTTEGKELKEAIQDIFNNRSADYIQIHNSSPGCYNCQVNRME